MNILIIFTSYLLGSLPTGFLIGKYLKNIDLRTMGSGSTGATNVLRNVGKWPALFVFIIDVGKGLIACLLYTSPSPRDGLLSRMPSSA